MPPSRDPEPDGPERDFARWREHADAAALGRVFDRLAPKLLIVAAHVADRGSAEDLVQTTFLHAIDRAERWDDARPLLPWLAGILVKLSLREKARARRELQPERVTLATAFDPGEEAQRHEVARAVAAAIAGLPLHYEQVLTLRLVHGLEPTAIAHALGAPVATVKSRLQRGLARLRDALPAGLQLPSVLVLPPASLDAVRVAVLERASAKAAAVAAASTAAAVPLAGTLIMAKLIAVAAGVALLAFLGAQAFDGTGAVTDEPPRGASAPVGLEPELAPPAKEAANLVAAGSSERGAGERVEVESTTPRDGSTDTSAAELDGEVNAPLVRGRVVDEAGAPLPGIRVLLGDRRFSPFKDVADFVSRAHQSDPRHLGDAADARRTTTDERGEFSLERPGSEFPYLLVAWSEERGARGVEPASDEPIELVLPIDARVSGTVQSAEDRAPIEGARVQVWPAKSGYPIAFERTAADGTYRLQPLPPGEYRVSVEADGFAERDTSFVLAVRQAVHDLSVDLESLPELRVQLVDRGGEPWTTGRLEDALGDDLAPGARWSVTVTEDSYARYGEMDAARWRVQHMDLGAGGLVTGHVSLPEARTLAVWRGPEKVLEAALPDLEARRLVVDLQEPSMVALQVRVRFNPPRDAATPIEIAVTDASGMVGRSAPIRARTTSLPECTLSIPAQFVGSVCGLSVQCEGRAPYLGHVTVPDATTDVWQEVVLSPPDGALSGVVVDEAGVPIAKARVTLVDRAGRTCLPFRLMLDDTDIDGRFALDGLPTQPMLALVSASGAAASCFEVDPRSAEDLRFVLREGREHSIKMPGSISAGQVRVVDDRGRPLLDDRISGTMRYGGAGLRLGRDAAAVEIYDASTGALVQRGTVPSSGPLVLDDVE